MSQIELNGFVRDQLEVMIDHAAQQEEFARSSLLAAPIREFTRWLIERIFAGTGSALDLHPAYAELGDLMGDHGCVLEDVKEVLDGMRRIIFGVVREVDRIGGLVGDAYDTMDSALQLLGVNNSELLERYVTIRERKMEETHLQNLEIVLDSIPNSILTYDENGLLTYANRTACELMEVDKDDIIGHRFDNLLPFPGYSLSGKKIWVTQEAIPLSDGRGSILIGYPIVRELEFYRILQAQTEFIFNAMTEGLVILDKDNIITTFNSRAEQLFDIPRSEIINRSGSLFLEKLQMDDHLSLLHETLATGNPFTDIQQTVRSSDGVERILKTSTRSLKGEDGEVLFAIGMFEDLTDRLFLEEQVRRAEKFSVLGKFAAGIAHEIRNPLTTAKGFLQLLPKDSPDPKIRQLKEVVIPEIDRANEIITDFLMIAKPSAPKLKIDSLHVLIDDLVALIQPQAIMQNVELSVIQAQSLSGAVAIDRDQLLQVFLNVTNNAFDAMSEGGRLEVELQNCISHVAVHFRDTGVGMDKEVIERIFEPFYTRKANGTGLGLAVSHRIIEGHNGTIHVTSNTGDGSTFTIQLPYS
ncbi:ATP-binding protein [Tumebacillus permanentifrigoris]|uniref:ATP-binding protein n=1 Tax=Tumebacillus permanentifrigoris TaxID=378543 RepID=UPI0011B1E23E|nr:ATP-binding protein [Tumebacillus permanentifrigoris]